MKYQACSKVTINGKKRILFQKTGSTTKYIKSKGRYVKFSAYKKALKKKSEKPKKRQKKRGGTGKYTEKDLRNTIRLNGKLYIRDKDSPNEPLLDYIGNMKPIAVNKAILVNGRIYNVASIFHWMKSKGNTTDPFDRESIEKYKSQVYDHYYNYYLTDKYGKPDRDIAKEIAKEVKNETEQEKKEALKKIKNQLNSNLIEEERKAERDKRKYKEYQKSPITNWMIRRIMERKLLRDYPEDYRGPDDPKNYYTMVDTSHWAAMKYRQKQDNLDKTSKLHGPLHPITRDRERLQKFEKFNQKYGSIGKKG
jgi:hypothetical protein